MIHLLNANALHIPLAANTVQCVITSPPYWGLRNYSVDAQLGLEATPDEFLANMVSVFREVWRVLKDTGVLFVNMGDSYGDGKQLQGMPWRLAFALQSDGWILRSDIIWHKPNPMPESVTDRPTKAHEYVFLLSKQGRYFYDADAIKEKGSGRKPGNKTYKYDGLSGHETKHGILAQSQIPQENRNKRTVWTVATQAYSSGAKTDRLRRVSKGAVSGGNLHIVLPDCPLHAGFFGQVAKAFCGEHVADDLNHIVGIYDRLASAHASLRQTNAANLCHLVSNLVSVPREYSPTAIDHNTENYKMAHALDSSLPYIPFFEKIAHTGGRLKSLALFVQHLCIFSNNILSDDLPANLWPKIPHHIVGRSSAALSMPYDNLDNCTCQYYEYYTRKPDHFATFPTTLVEPMILAGSRPGDLVMDPFSGTATVGEVSRKHHRRYVGLELNPEYIELAKERTQHIQPTLLDFNSVMP